MRVPRRILFGALALAGCFDDLPPGRDAGLDVTAGDAPSADVASDLDVAERPDISAPDDRAPTADAGAPDDRPGAPLADAPDAAACASDRECVDPLAPQCDPSTGRCVACLPSRDLCPPAQHCDPAARLCVPGCRSDEGCAAEGDGGLRRCDTARNACVECARDEQCPAMTVCASGACVPGCNSQRGCAAGETCCEGSCHDITRDPAHCGACGRGCSYRNATPRCAIGACSMGACTDPYVDCDRNVDNGCETNAATSVTDCGACGNRCPTPAHAASATCAAGRCGFACAEGFADCDGDPANGCETGVASDPSACGRCGVVCPTAPGALAPVCVAGRCGLRCSAGRGDCDGDLTNGCEESTQSSVAHCGACGAACASGPHSRATCAAGRCALQCDAGWGDCDGVPGNGCETNLASAASHCGGCGRACVVPGGTAACVDGQCRIAACGAVFADCDRNPANGCEADLRADPTNCAACNTRCASAPNAAAVCADGACGTRCLSGWGDCDGTPGNGCERDLRSNPTSCGACGRTCSLPRATAACSGGSCVVSACIAGYGDCDGVPGNGCETNLASSPAHCGACGRVGEELCDGADNDCDGLVDEGCPTGLANLDATAFTSPTFGNRTGSSFDLACPAGTFARGMSGRVGSYLTQIALQCGRPRLVEDRSGRVFRYTVALDAAPSVGPAGIASGTAWSFNCPGNSVIGRIDGRTSGSVIYQLSFDCFDLSVTGSPTAGFQLSRAAASASSPNFGPNSGSAFSWDSPASPSASVLRSVFGTYFPIRVFYVSSLAARSVQPTVVVR